MTDSSESSEEDTRLREALDPHMFNKEAATFKKEETKAVFEVKNHYKDNVLNVTPEFQSYIAKHLSDILNKSIQEYEAKEINVEESDQSGGIKLFQSSQEILTSANFSDSFVTECPKKKKRKHSHHESEATLLKKARSVAVSPEWVLQKQGIRGWSKPKGKEIKVKRNAAGELEIIEPPFISK